MKTYCVKSNVTNWIMVSLFYVIYANFIPFDNPEIALYYGIAFGYLLMWAQEILREWVAQKK